MKVCTKCHREYPNESMFCDDDGGLLVRQVIPEEAEPAVPPKFMRRETSSPEVTLPDNGDISDIPPAPGPPVRVSPAMPPPAWQQPPARPPQRSARGAWLVGAAVVALLCLGLIAKHFSRSRATAVVSGNPGPTPPPPAAVGPFATDSQDPTIVTNFGVPLLTQLVPYGKNSPAVRAKRIADRMNDCFLNDLKPPRTVKNMRQGYLRSDTSGTEYVFFGYLHQGGNHDTADIVATVDPVTAAHCKVSPVVLACWWRDVLRDWLLIDHGQAPQFTVAYTPVMKDFYKDLPPGGDDVTAMTDRFQKAADTLTNTNDEYEQLRGLSSTVPPHYVARPDNYTPALNDDGGPSTSG